MELALQWSPIILMLLVAGSVAGMLAGLLGVGGGIVIVPVLYLVFQSIGIPPSTAMLVAIGTSLMTIVPTSVSSALAHYKEGNIDFVLLKRWVVPMLAGVVIGSFVATRVDGLVLAAVFGCIAMLVAFNTLFRSGALALNNHLPSQPVQAGLAAGIGFFSVMMGIGGGTLSVPAMTRVNVPPHRAVGTAALFGVVIAFPGALIMLFGSQTPVGAPTATFGTVNLLGFMVIIPMTILFAPIGVKLGAKIDGVTLKKVFALFLLAVGLRMIWQTLSGMTG